MTAALCPHLALAQGACPATLPAPDPCMIGTWMGENTAGQRIYDMIQRNPPPGVDRTTIPVPPAMLGITIFEDGFYATLPLHTEAGWTDVSEHDTVAVQMDLSVGSEFGHIWTEGGQLKFCTTGENLVTLLTKAQSGLGGEGETVTSPLGDPAFRPRIGYNCSGDFMDWTVQLPAPINTVAYNLQKFDEDRFSDEWRDLLAIRGDLVIDPFVIE
ncbi:hypothetical protein V8J84_05595 [Yoonia sp. 208BN28-4]